MKHHTQWLVTALAVAGGLALVNSVQAQGVTGTPYLSNMEPSSLNTAPSALYANWASATFSSVATGLKVNSAGYGSLYYVIPAGNVQTLSPTITHATLSFTVNGDAAPYVWIGTPFTLNDNFGAVVYGGYSGYGNGGNPPEVVWNGNTATWTLPLAPGQLAAIQAGNDAIYSFNLNLDPAVLGAPSYDVTFNSLVLSSPVPEPSALALAGLGAAVLLLLRRRK